MDTAPLLVLCFCRELNSIPPRVPRLPLAAVVTPTETPDTHWIRVYCPLGMADLFGAYLEE